MKINLRYKSIVKATAFFLAGFLSANGLVYAQHHEKKSSYHHYVATSTTNSSYTTKQTTSPTTVTTPKYHTTQNSKQSNNFQKQSQQVMTQITGNKPSALQKHIDQQKAATSFPLGITFYKPTYVLPAYYTASPYNSIYRGNTPDNQKLDRLEFKFQLSLLIPIFSTRLDHKPLNLNFAYTQLSYWQFYAKSQYFRETDYEPEVFASYNFHKNWWLNLGVVHQSNGRGGDLERSWNRVYTDLVFSGQNWMASIKPWILIFKNDSSNLHNPDITHYLGNGSFLFAYKFGRNEISFMSRNNLQSGFSRGAEELDWSVHIWKHFYLYTQFFSGYGQSLIEYNHYTNAFGIGIALNNWL